MGIEETGIVKNRIGQTEKADESLIEKTAVEESGNGQNEDTVLAKTENPKAAEEVIQPKERLIGKPSGGKAGEEKLEVGEKKTKEPVTPVAFSTDHPVRERKSVERLVTTASESIRKFRLEKGRGAALKDIPNVANQLKKHTADETFKMLHYVLFGRHMKAFKSNLKEFSGFACHKNEKRIKEKLDKFVVARLLEFCNVLDIHVAYRSRIRKEEIVAELVNFLAAPRVTTDVVPATVSAEKTAVEESGNGISQNEDTVLAETENPKVAEEVKQSKKRVIENPCGGKAEEEKLEVGEKKTNRKKELCNRKNTGGKAEDEKLEVGEKKTKVPVTPVAFSTDRPVRERKSVERLVSAVEPESIRKYRLEQGRGVALEDIPNVAKQLKSKEHKVDETFKTLHFMLFGRHMKVFKRNLSEFSGFAGDENEERIRSKIKVKLDKYLKEGLLEFCYVLDIHIGNKARITKEEIVAELVNFLAAPCVTTDVVPAESEQDEMVAELLNFLATPRVTTDVVPAENEQKRRKTFDTIKDGEKKSSQAKEDDSEEDKENENGVLDGSENEVAEHSPRMDEDSDPEEVDEPAQDSVESFAKTEASRKCASKKTSTPKGTEDSKSKDEDSDSEEEASQKFKLKKTPTPEKATTVSSPERQSTPSTSKHSEAESSRVRTPVETPKRKRSALSKSATNLTVNKEEAGKKLVKGNPSENELRCKMAQMLHEVDFKTATSILKKLATHYDMDLIPKTYE